MKTKSCAGCKVVRQVAHDIQSPIAALEIVAEDLNHFPKAKKILLSSAVHRIKGIAAKLLVKSPIADTQSCFLPPLVESIITEKRVQIRSRAGISIYFLSPRNRHTFFVRINPVDLMIILSNLLDNSIEAIETTGSIYVTLKSINQDSIEMVIADQGRGISPIILGNLLERGGTYGKPTGSGLGLTHAKACIEKWGGSIEIFSKIGKGTQVVLRLLKALP